MGMKNRTWASKELRLFIILLCHGLVITLLSSFIFNLISALKWKILKPLSFVVTVGRIPNTGVWGACVKTWDIISAERDYEKLTTN